MKTKVLIIALALIAAAAVMVKIWLFPSIKDSYFAMDGRSLLQVPAGMLIVRPTHFGFLHEKGILRVIPPPSGKNSIWLMGRNLPLRDVMAAGYDWSPTRVMLPPDATTGRFDVLMTGTSNQLTGFQTVIRRKLGYTAKMESQSADVLALKIADPALRALTISRTDEKRRINLRDEKLYFTQVPLSIMINVFGRFLETPMVDKTGTTNLYDFSIDWNSKTEQSYDAGTMTRDKVDQFIGALGLKLEPDTAPLDMLVVKKAN